jgi:ATP-dependent DNA helicase DinG
VHKRDYEDQTFYGECKSCKMFYKIKFDNCPELASKDIDLETVNRVILIKEEKEEPKTSLRPRINRTRKQEKIKNILPPKVTRKQVKSEDISDKHLIISKITDIFTELENSNLINGYSKRQQQIDMAIDVDIAIAKKRLLLVESGVGTGKTLAYLIPAYLYKTKSQTPLPIIISTKNKNLQEQVFNKDIPVVEQFALRSFRGYNDFPTVLSKGKRNYCCRQRLTIEFNKKPSDELLSVLDWLGESKTGDLEEPGAPKIPLNLKLTAEECNNICEYGSGCQFYKMKLGRQDTKGIIVTNHNQLISDLKWKSRGMPGLWRKPCMIIIDEAHALEDVARNELAYHISIPQMWNMLRSAEKTPEINLEKIKKVNSPLKQFTTCLRKSIVENTLGRSANRFIIKTDENFMNALNALQDTWNQAKDTLEISQSAIQEYRLRESQRRLYDNMDEINNNLILLRQHIANQESSTYALWAEKIDNDRQLVLAPLSVGAFLQKYLWSMCPIVLTSGTLTVNDSFEHFRFGLGIESNYEENKYLSPFNYEQNVRIYIPKDIPSPKHLEEEQDDPFTAAIADRLAVLLRYSKGRALLLFTSHYRMQAVHEYLTQVGLPYKILMQNEAGRQELLREFRDDKNSILLATGSFWEGVDVVGDALSLLVMDKLPFQQPNDPLFEGLKLMATKNGKNPKKTIELPIMLKMLKQGGGRLIRQEDDTGIIALLDRRVYDQQYEELVKQHLPSAPWTDNIDDLKDWFKEH